MSVGARNRGDTNVLEFISQPCGPRKLAKALQSCINRQQVRFDSLRGEECRPGGSGSFGADISTDEPEMDSLLSPSSNGHGSDQSTTQVIADPKTHTRANTAKLESLRLCRENVDDYLFPSEEVATTSHDTPIKKENSPISTTPTTVLLVDDNEINLRILIAFMKKLNCDYVIAQNGEEALEVFKANSSAVGMIFMGRPFKH